MYTYPMNIHPNTKIGPVSLTVSDMARSLTYYQQNIGLKLHHQEANTAVLGSGETELLQLMARPSVPKPRRSTGLYHFALLLPSRLELAKTLTHLINTETAIAGASDHLVSEALYLSDPDGNGIEIYRDRPRDEWKIINDVLQMSTEPLDVQGVLSELNSATAAWNGLHQATIMGHIHLHVNYLDQAEAFYTDILGFDLVTRYGPSAAFVSAGGYHHHIGLNTWAGVGAPPPPDNAVGLNWFTIVFPDQDALQATAVRLQSADIPYEKRGDGLFLRDPANNGILLSI